MTGFFFVTRFIKLAWTLNLILILFHSNAHISISIRSIALSVIKQLLE